MCHCRFDMPFLRSLAPVLPVAMRGNFKSALAKCLFAAMCVSLVGNCVGCQKYVSIPQSEPVRSNQFSNEEWTGSSDPLINAAVVYVREIEGWQHVAVEVDPGIDSQDIWIIIRHLPIAHDSERFVQLSREGLILSYEERPQSLGVNVLGEQPSRAVEAKKTPVR